MNLTPGPELDKRVCEVLNIPSRKQIVDGPSIGGTYTYEDRYPALSTDPATIPVLMEGTLIALEKRGSRDHYPVVYPQRNYGVLTYTAEIWHSRTGRDDRWGSHEATAINHSLCKLVVLTLSNQEQA